MPSPVLPPALAARRRRSRVVYGGVVLAALLAVGLTMGLVIGTGEAAHASLVTGTAAPAVPGGTVRPAPTPVWHTTDTAAGDNPLWVGTVVTWSAHRLAGRDAATGAIRWSYTRTDLSICDAAQRNGRAFVLYGRDGDCDELSTFDTETGSRGWFRTLPDDGEGHLQFGNTGLLISYPDSFHAMTEAQGYDRFPMVPTTGSDCRFTGVVAGVTGILASERCADGEHLAMWSNDGVKSLPQRLWRVDVTAGVTAVGENGVSAFAYDPVSGTLSRYAEKDGATVAPLTLDPTTTGPAGPSQVAGGELLLDLGDRVYDITQSGTVGWSSATVGPPTVAGSNADQVLLPTTSGADLAALTGGRVQASYTLPAGGDAGGDGPRVYAAGGGLLVAGPGLTYLR